MAIDVDNHEDRCGICLNLQPRFFQPLDPSHFCSKEYKESRLHCVTFHGIEKSAADGCPLCSILKQGIDQLWPLQTDRTFQPPPAEPLSVREAFIEPWSDEEESTGLWSDEEDSTNTQEWDLCIEIRPGRSLLVFRVDRQCVRSIVKGKYCQSKLCVDRPWRTPIEFFSLNSKLLQRTEKMLGSIETHKAQRSIPFMKASGRQELYRQYQMTTTFVIPWKSGLRTVIQITKFAAKTLLFRENFAQKD